MQETRNVVIEVQEREEGEEKEEREEGEKEGEEDVLTCRTPMVLHSHIDFMFQKNGLLHV